MKTSVVVLVAAVQTAAFSPVRHTTTFTRASSLALNESPLDNLFDLAKNLLPKEDEGAVKQPESSPMGSLQGFLGNFLPSEEKEPEPEPEPLPDVVIDPDFKLAGIFLAAGLFLDIIPYIQLTLGPIVTLLGILFLVQTFRVRFTFDQEAFELRIGDGLEKSGENVVVGGANRWTYDSFVNWEFFPEGWIDEPQGPILVYFKETQTPQESWEEGPGKFANSGDAVAKGAVPGQVHFFPALCNCQQLKEEFYKRECAKIM